MKKFFIYDYIFTAVNLSGDEHSYNLLWLYKLSWHFLLNYNVYLNQQVRRVLVFLQRDLVINF